MTKAIKFQLKRKQIGILKSDCVYLKMFLFCKLCYVLTFLKISVKYPKFKEFSPTCSKGTLDDIDLKL